MLLWTGSVLAPFPSGAALGDDHVSVEADRRALQASLRLSENAGYRVSELQTELGVTIRQYETLSGTVFAVTWRGPFKPDLRQLLGSHFDSYRSAPRTPAALRGRAARIVVPGGVVVQSEGHSRSFSGYAYLPALLPAGMSVDDLR